MCMSAVWLIGHARVDKEAYPCLKQYAVDGDNWLFSHVPTRRHAKAQKSRPQAAARPASSAAAAAPSGPAVSGAAPRQMQQHHLQHQVPSRSHTLVCLMFPHVLDRHAPVHGSKLWSHISVVVYSLFRQHHG